MVLFKLHFFSKRLEGHGIEQAAAMNWSQLMKREKKRFTSWPDETKETGKTCDVIRKCALLIDKQLQ